MMRATEDAHIETVKSVCAALLDDEPERARAIARSEYPFFAPPNVGRHITDIESMRVFLRDRFTDRYSGHGSSTQVRCDFLRSSCRTNFPRTRTAS